jgi:hypothetical protein
MGNKEHADYVAEHPEQRVALEDLVECASQCVAHNGGDSYVRRLAEAAVDYAMRLTEHERLVVLANRLQTDPRDRK